MEIAALVARILLGLMFVAAGSFAFLTLKSPPPPMPGLAGMFMQAFVQSHWVIIIGIFDILAGMLLLLNRYVAIGLLILAGVIVNILSFHITMAPGAIVPGVVALGLWLTVAFSIRERFDSLLRP